MGRRKHRSTPPNYVGFPGVPPIYGMPQMFMPHMGFPFGMPMAQNMMPGPRLVPPPPPPVQSGPAPPKSEPKIGADLPNLDLDLPAPENVTDILVFEFDRALFHTPTPNLDLLEPPSARMVETDLGDESWWVNPKILQAADEFCGEWNEELVDILKLATETEGVFTAIVSGRTSENEDQIRKMLGNKGVGEFDCLILGDARQQIRGRKCQLVSTLWSHFRFANRLIVYEGRPKDARGLRGVLNSLATEVRNGLLLREVAAPLVLFPPLVERQLLEDAVQNYNKTHERQITAEILKLGYVHRLTAASRQLIFDKIRETEILHPDQIITSPVKVEEGSFDLQTRDLTVETEWKITETSIENGILSIHLVANENESTRIPLCGKLKNHDEGPVDWLDGITSCFTKCTLERRLHLRS